MFYAYARVSTTSQNLDRQIEAFNKYRQENEIKHFKMILEKQSGKI